MIGGHTVGQSVRPAGIFRNISANGAGTLAGRIGRVEIAARLDCECDIQVHDARLQHGALVFEIDFEDAIHASECDGDAAGARYGSAA